MRQPSVLVLLALTLASSLVSPALPAAQHGRPAGSDAAQGTMPRDQLHDQDRLHDRDRPRDRDIYGSQLMTSTERSAYRKKLRSAKTEQERETLRAQHHEEMQKRARERGVTLPDSPPGQDAAAPQPGQERTEQETRERTQQGTPSTSGQGTPKREQEEQEQRERDGDDQSDGH